MALGAQARLEADIVVDALRRLAKPADPPAPVVWPLEGSAESHRDQVAGLNGGDREGPRRQRGPFGAG